MVSDLLKISSLSLSLVERTDVKIEEHQRNELSIEVVEPPRKRIFKVKQPTFLEEDSNLIRRLVQFLFYFQNLLWLAISLILAKGTEVLRFKRMYFNFRSKRPKVKNKNLDDFEIPLKGSRVADNQSAGTLLL